MAILERLDWDSTFFGFRVAKIVNPKASAMELREAVSLMQSNEIPLAYWAADKFSPELHQLVVSLGGRLVDEKLTYVARLADCSDSDLPRLRLVEPYQDGMSMIELKHLAVQSGISSRFVVDPQFPQDKARDLFEEWIVRSVSKAVADEVLVIRDETRIAGMATLVRAGDKGSLGLIAVAEDFRGQKLGEALVRAAQRWWRDRGCLEIQVVTQQANVPAQRLYRKCGFELQKTEFYYHLWRGPSLSSPSP